MQVMSNERALELLKMATVMGSKVDKCALPLAQAVRAAIKALELQIAEEPKLDEKYNEKIACPKCGELLTENLKHCPNCGKLILWPRYNKK